MGFRARNPHPIRTNINPRFCIVQFAGVALTEGELKLRHVVLNHESPRRNDAHQSEVEACRLRSSPLATEPDPELRISG